MILETEANFKLLSPLLEIQIKDDSSCELRIKDELLEEETSEVGSNIHFFTMRLMRGDAANLNSRND